MIQLLSWRDESKKDMMMPQVYVNVDELYKIITEMFTDTGSVRRVKRAS